MSHYFSNLLYSLYTDNISKESLDDASECVSSILKRLPFHLEENSLSLGTLTLSSSKQFWAQVRTLGFSNRFIMKTTCPFKILDVGLRLKRLSPLIKIRKLRSVPGGHKEVSSILG
jgi:hypothetical protein